MRMLVQGNRFAEVGPHPDVSGRPGGIVVRMTEPAGYEFFIEVSQSETESKERPVEVPVCGSASRAA